MDPKTGLFAAVGQNGRMSAGRARFEGL